MPAVKQLGLLEHFRLQHPTKRSSGSLYLAWGSAHGTPYHYHFLPWICQSIGYREAIMRIPKFQGGCKTYGGQEPRGLIMISARETARALSTWEGHVGSNTASWHSLGHKCPQKPSLGYWTSILQAIVLLPSPPRNLTIQAGPLAISEEYKK